eukprot:9514837-Alexandrium_andersonii.AAC.1
MHRQLEDYMEQKGISLLALSETRASSTSKYVVGSTTFITSSSVEQGREYAGVGVAISKPARKYLMYATPVDSRILIVGLGCAPREIVVVAVYAPQEGRPPEEREEFY